MHYFFQSPDPRSETGSGRIYGKCGVTDCESETHTHTQVNNYHLMWSCLIIRKLKQRTGSQMGVIRCGAKGFLCQLSVRGHKCASAVTQLIQHSVVLSGKQQGLEAVTSPLQHSTQLSEYGWWHEAMCTFLQRLMTCHASAELATRIPFLCQQMISDR